MKTFKLHTNGKTYKVAVRGAFQHSITSEKKLLASLKKSAENYFDVNARPALLAKLEAGKIHEVCEVFGVLAYSCPIEK